MLLIDLISWSSSWASYCYPSFGMCSSHEIQNPEQLINVNYCIPFFTHNLYSVPTCFWNRVCMIYMMNISVVALVKSSGQKVKSCLMFIPPMNSDLFHWRTVIISKSRRQEHNTEEDFYFLNLDFTPLLLCVFQKTPHYEDKISQSHQKCQYPKSSFLLLGTFFGFLRYWRESEINWYNIVFVCNKSTAEFDSYWSACSSFWKNQ